MRHEDRINAERTYRCSYTGCDFGTNIGSHLRRHLRSHTGSKPYKCRYCSYASSNLVGRICGSTSAIRIPRYDEGISPNYALSSNDRIFASFAATTESPSSARLKRRAP